jgi:hypothetical protein
MGQRFQLRFLGPQVREVADRLIVGRLQLRGVPCLPDVGYLRGESDLSKGGPGSSNWRPQKA